LESRVSVDNVKTELDSQSSYCTFGNTTLKRPAFSAKTTG